MSKHTPRATTVADTQLDPHQPGYGNPSNLSRRLPGDLDQPLPLDGLPDVVSPLDAPDDRVLAVEGIAALLRLMGRDPDRDPGIADTPDRVIKAYLEMSSHPGDPAELMARVFEGVDYDADQMIAVGPVEFTSLCEHHLLPFTGKAWVGYIPTNGTVVGLSKLPRLVDHYARQPQVQERLTAQIADALENYLDPQGVGVVIKASHACAGLRGVRKPDAIMTTSALRGAFLQGATRSEFLALTRGR